MKAFYQLGARTVLALFALGMLLGGLSISAPAHAGALTDYAENKIIDCSLRGQSCGFPASWYIGLSTATCTDSSNGTEPSGGAYARVAVTSSLANWAGTQSAGSTVASSGTGGTTSNNAAITFPESTASWGNIQSALWYDASTAGNAWICVNLTASFNVSASGITVRFPAGTLQFQVDN